ncbi:hypothetical protein IX327_001122 [Porphyromonas levii]|nr:hypothetical protein [Porphyromonas levii]
MVWSNGVWSIHDIETVARWRTTALLSTFGFGHVREYASVSLSLSALYFTTVQRLSPFACKLARMTFRITFSYNDLRAYARSDRVERDLGQLLPLLGDEEMVT